MNLQLFGECRKKMIVKGKFSVVWDFLIDVLLLSTFSPLSLYRLLGNLLSFRRISILLLFLFPQPPIKAILEFSPIPDGFPKLEKMSDNSCPGCTLSSIAVTQNTSLLNSLLKETLEYK